MVKPMVTKQLSLQHSLFGQSTTPLILFSDSAKHNSEKQWEVRIIAYADDSGTGNPVENVSLLVTAVATPENCQDWL